MRGRILAPLVHLRDFGPYLRHNPFPNQEMNRTCSSNNHLPTKAALLEGVFEMGHRRWSRRVDFQPSLSNPNAVPSVPPWRVLMRCTSLVIDIGPGDKLAEPNPFVLSQIGLKDPLQRTHVCQTMYLPNGYILHIIFGL